jgi:hypothetical protein
MKLDALLFDPLLPLWLMVALAACVLAALALAAVRRLAGWPYRGLAVICVFLALLNPSLKTEERQAEADIVLVVVDRSSSQGCRIAPRKRRPPWLMLRRSWRHGRQPRCGWWRWRMRMGRVVRKL